MSTFRRYIKVDSLEEIVDFNLQDINPNVKEYHIVLAFATDYDDRGNHSNGNFTFKGDPTRISEAISDFNKSNPNVKIKLFISIGSRDSNFSFEARGLWLDSATESLKKIFRTTLRDVTTIDIGIDVFYEKINTPADVFASHVGQLITNLKSFNLIAQVSITPSAATKNEYTALFEKYGNSIDWVVYQFYNDTLNGPQEVIERYRSLTTFPEQKRLAGYSTNKNDWTRTKPVVFYKGIISLVRDNRAPGASIWDADELVANAWAILPFGVAT